MQILEIAVDLDTIKRLFEALTLGDDSGKFWLRDQMDLRIIEGHIFNSVWLSDAIWRCRSGSTLAQLMACCPTVPSHYLNQCWLVIRKAPWHSSDNRIWRYQSVQQVWKLHAFSESQPDVWGTNELNCEIHLCFCIDMQGCKYFYTSGGYWLIVENIRPC